MQRMRKTEGAGTQVRGHMTHKHTGEHTHTHTHTYMGAKCAGTTDQHCIAGCLQTFPSCADKHMTSHARVKNVDARKRCAHTHTHIHTVPGRLAILEGALT